MNTLRSKVQRINQLLILIIILFGSIRTSLGSDTSYLFDYDCLTTEDGLANLLTRAIYQDKKGFIWVSTRYGLNRYDGYKFELFTKEENNLFSNDVIERIMEDDRGNIWLFYTGKQMTGNFSRMTTAIDVFQPVTQKAISLEAYLQTSLPFTTQDVVLPLVNGDFSNLRIATKKGEIFTFQNQQFTKRYTIPNGLVHCLTQDAKGNEWIGVDNQLWKFNPQMEQLVLVDTFSLPIQYIWSDQQEGIWLATTEQREQSKQVQLYQKKEHTKPQPFFLRSANEKFSLENLNEANIYRDPNGSWLVCFEHFLYLFDPQGEQIDLPTEKAKLNATVSLQNTVKVGDKLWVTSGLGVFRYNIQQNKFHNISTADIFDCRGITEDADGNIYLLDKKIYQYQPEINKSRAIVDATGTYHLFKQENSFLTGIYFNSELFREYDFSNAAIHSYVDSIVRFPFCSALLAPENLLVGTSQGLVYADLNAKTVRPFLKYNQFTELVTAEINAIYENKSGIGLWLATSKGVYLMDEEKGILKAFNTATGNLPFDNIRHLYEDEDGSLWLASKGGGLLHVRFTEGESATITEQFIEKDGLSCDFLYAVYADDFNNLWIASDKGLLCFNKSTQAIRTYLQEDGIPHYEFNHTSHYQSKNGTLYFGTLAGFFSFHPKEVAQDFTYDISLFVTGVYLLEGDKEGLSDKTISFNQEPTITFQPSDKFLELQFSLMDYAGEDKHNYIYKIEGFSDTWSSTNGNSIRITNLPYGDYNLKIKGQNIQKGWSTTTLNIPIYVLKPFYLRWWFFALLAAVLLLGIYTFIKGREYQLRKEANRLEELVRLRTAQIEEDKQVIAQQSKEIQALDVAKSRFFSNVTHEFRTPLTLIIGPLEQYLAAQSAKPLQTALQNAKRLQLLINQLLDIAKLEHNKMRVEWKHGDIIDYTKRLVDYLQPLAQQKEISLLFNPSRTTWKTYFDEEKWDKIIFNLLSNAIKFTNHRGLIQLNLCPQLVGSEEKVVLMVQDTGIGIEPTRLPHVFDRFYQADNSATRGAEGTSIGLALVKELVEVQSGQIEVVSEIDKGTTFEIHLPTAPTNGSMLAESVGLAKKDWSYLAVDTVITEIHSDNIATQLATSEKLSVLIIEDNSDMRRYIQSCIEESLNLQIIAAINGEDGLNKAFEYIPDLIISDVMMPRKDGFMVTAALRADIRTSHIPIILLTAKAALESKLAGLESGADAYLSKPFSPQELVVRIRKLIELRQLMQQYFTDRLEVSNKKAEEANLNFAGENEFLQSVNEIIATHMGSSQLTGEFLAEQLFFSKGHFYRKIKALTNQTPHQYINRIRIQRALPLLKEEGMTISEVAYKVGFSSPSYFTRVCKQLYGKTPTELVKE
ncbi:MAG: ATP-binding protein [Saprospiraceae bacterium]